MNKYHVYKKSVLTQSKLQSVHLPDLMALIDSVKHPEWPFETDKYIHIVISGMVSTARQINT